MSLSKMYKKSDAKTIDPFEIEKNRQKIAETANLEKLKTTYSNNLPEINDLNTAPFWDERLNKKHTLQMEDGMTQERIKAAFEFLPMTVKKVLDIGVGYGFIEEMLSSRRSSLEFYGNDISDIAIEYIKSRFPGKYKVESVYTMEYPKEFFDAVFLLEVLEHITPSKTFVVLGKIKKVLKKSGYFILSVPMNEGLEHMKNNPNGHVRMYTPQLITAELKIAGFEVMKYKTIYAFPSMYWLKSQIAKVWKRWKPNNIIILARSI